MADIGRGGSSESELGSTDRGPLDRPGTAHLLIVAPDGTWTKRSLPARGALTIGRAAETDIPIDDRAISHLHARLEVIGPGELRVADLGSTNGTFMGDSRVGATGVMVRPGDLILIGRTCLVWHVPPVVGGSAAGTPPLLSLGLALAKGTQPPVQPGLAMAGVEMLISKVAPRMTSVLLLGETGVGKGVVAEHIHRLSTRANGPLVQLNCASFRGELFESELFGHERGAFTGAVQNKPGLLEVATGGTVFLDEIGEMPLEVQAKLLVAIDQRIIRRVGATKSTRLDVRFICATHRDLETEVRLGRFREDLYYRINQLTIGIPPLRERRDEIDGLVSQFASDEAMRSHLVQPPTFDEDALAALRRHDWPGNIRQLRNIVERAIVYAEGTTVTSRVLADAGFPAGAPPAPRSTATHAERDRVIAALTECGGNQRRAAKLLGISRNTLRDWMRRYGIPLPRGGADE